jgi:prevent-host-death family protein
MSQLKRKSASTTTVNATARKPSQKWQLQSAKAQFSEVFRRAWTEGPQHVTRQGKEEVVIISKEEFDKLTAPPSKPGGAWEFFRNSPLVGLDLDLERDEDYGRDIEL